MKARKNTYKIKNKIKTFCLIVVLVSFLFLSTLILNSCTTPPSDGERSVEDEVTKEIVESESIDEENLTTLSEESGKSEEESPEQANKTSTSSGIEKDNESVKEKLGVFVYFADENGEFLIGELRYVSRENYLAEAVLELLKGPDASNLISLIPSTTKLIDIKQENGIARVNFSKGFIEDKLQSDLVDRFVIYSIVNTLTEFDDIKAVEFFIEGNKLDKYGQLDVSGPIYREPALIKHNE